MNASIHHLTRAERPPLPRLGLYLRVGRNQHRDMESALMLADGVFGLVIDPTCEDRHADLVTLAKERSIDVILDPRTQELALEGGWTETLGSLPWANEDRPQSFADFKDLSRVRLIRALSQHVVDKGYTGVLAPSHYVLSPDDDWLDVDVRSCVLLRSELNKLGASKVQVIYSLAVPYKLLRNPDARLKIVEAIARASVDAVWLKISGLGGEATATAIRNYIQASADFHLLGIPIIADHMGGIGGQSLLAFGAVGGVAHGITLKERFDAGSWLKPRIGKGFQPQSRIYVSELGLYMERAVAEVFFENSRAKSRFGCPDAVCCPKGHRDTTENPVRHAVRRKSEEVRLLSDIPISVRPGEFVDRVVRPASDQAVFASQLNFSSSGLAKRLQKVRKLRNDQRVSLTELAERFDPKGVSELPLQFVDRV